jgi:hypothetical protein
MHRHRLSAAVLAVTLGAALFTTAGGASASERRPRFTPPVRADNPGSPDNPKPVDSPTEPATIVDRDGVRYVAYQNGSQLSLTRDGGRTWTYLPANVLSSNLTGCTSATEIGDVEMTTDQSGRSYFADLQAVAGPTADTGIEPVVAYSDTHFLAPDAATPGYHGTCAAHQPFSVDREWMAAYTAPGKTAAQSDVYLTYHDFGPDAIWVNASHDGGVTWSTPVNVPASSPTAAADSACDTVPGGVAVDPRNGWVYVSWVAGDSAATNVGTGCNYTQATVFNKLYVAVSKDSGATWNVTLAYQGDGYSSPDPSDMSEIFTSLATDRQGGVYASFPAYRDGQFGVYLTSSAPADAAGALAFAPAEKVNGPEVQTAYFTRIVAGDAGRVDVMYLGSPVKNVIATPANKLAYTGADPAQPNCTPEVSDPGNKGVRDIGKPCEMPATSPWYLYLAQTLDNGATFTTQKLRNDPVHIGDICTLGIFCLGGDNRDLADTNDIKIDRTGGFQVAYTDETYPGGVAHNEIDFQCQTDGEGLFARVKVKSCR